MARYSDDVKHKILNLDDHSLLSIDILSRGVDLDLLENTFIMSSSTFEFNFSGVSLHKLQLKVRSVMMIRKFLRTGVVCCYYL